MSRFEVVERKENQDEEIPEELIERIGEDKEWLEELLAEYRELLEKFNQKVRENSGMDLLNRKLLASELVEPNFSKKEIYTIDHFMNKFDDDSEKIKLRKMGSDVDEMDMLMFNIKANMREELKRFYKRELPEGHLESVRKELLEHMDDKVFELERAEFENALTENDLTQELKDAFEENGYPLADTCQLREKNDEWFIIETDGEQDVLFTIRDENDILIVSETNDITSTEAKLFIARSVADDMDKRKFWLLWLLFSHIDMDYVTNEVTEQMENCYPDERKEEKESFGMMYR